MILKSQKLLVGREVAKGYFFTVIDVSLASHPFTFIIQKPDPVGQGRELAGHGRGQEAPEEVWAMAPTLGTKTNKPLGVFGQLTHLEGGSQ